MPPLREVALQAPIYQGLTARVQRPRGLASVVDRSPGRVRVNVGEVLEPTWSELVILFSIETVGQQERIQSRLLHDPFRVDGFTIHTTAPEANSLNWIVGFSQEQNSGVAGSDRTTRGFGSVSGDNAGLQEVTGVAWGTALAVGTIIRNVPGRVFLNILSGEAATKNTVATVSITHLRPAAA